jgi:hypothetical protein
LRLFIAQFFALAFQFQAFFKLFGDGGCLDFLHDLLDLVVDRAQIFWAGSGLKTGARTGFIDQIDGFIGEITVGDVAVGEFAAASMAPGV